MIFLTAKTEGAILQYRYVLYRLQKLLTDIFCSTTIVRSCGIYYIASAVALRLPSSSPNIQTPSEASPVLVSYVVFKR